MNLNNSLYCWLTRNTVEYLDTNVVKLISNDSFTCSINLASELKCWFSKTLQPLIIDNDLKYDVVDISTDDQNICVVDIYAYIHCYEITTGIKFTPTKMQLRSVEGGYSHTCAINVGGGLICWNKSIIVNKAVVPFGFLTGTVMVQT